MQINIVRPSGEHSGIFIEWAELIYYAAQEIGHEATISVDESKNGCLNIVIGIFYSDKFLESLPEDSVLINTEPLFSRVERPDWTERMIKYGSRYEVWDYDLKNIEVFHRLGIHNVQLFEFGYQKELQRIPIFPDSEQVTDVLFYGSTNQRRKDIFEQMYSRGIRLYKLFGRYGTTRDEYIGKSKMIINLHYNPDSLFEIVRIHYLLNNGIAVVTEKSPSTFIASRYLDCIAPAPYENLVDKCLELKNNSELLHSLRSRALSEFKKFPQAQFLASLLVNRLI